MKDERWLTINELIEPGTYWVKGGGKGQGNNAMRIVEYRRGGLFYTGGIDVALTPNPKWKFYGPLPEPPSGL